jgi:RNA polymerase sigma-70 factor, ECF subfamily
MARRRSRPRPAGAAQERLNAECSSPQLLRVSLLSLAFKPRLGGLLGCGKNGHKFVRFAAQILRLGLFNDLGFDEKTKPNIDSSALSPFNLQHSAFSISWNSHPLPTEYLLSASNRQAMNGSDDELMAAIVAGDREAFAALYRRCRPQVYRFAVHMTGVPAAAEDVTQDVFLAVIRDAHRYRTGRSGVVPWLLGIARNHARRRISSTRATDPLPDGEAPVAEALTVTADPLEALARERRVRDLRRALRTLPVTYREVIVLCDLQELTYADAAAAVGCAIGTIRSRLHRGRALLAARLKGEQRADARRMLPGWVL